MGEFNVNKSDGSLEQTAGMPDTYPADQVMMSDGVTSVEDAVDGKANLAYFDQYTVSVVSQPNDNIQIHFNTVGIQYYLNGQQIWTINKDS